MQPICIDHLIAKIKEGVDKHKLADGDYARFLWNNPAGTRKMGANEYGCADAANILYTIGAFPTDPGERAAFVRRLQAMQDPVTGQYYENTHHTKRPATTVCTIWRSWLTPTARSPFVAISWSLSKRPLRIWTV